jgi:hypothetical protein
MASNAKIIGANRNKYRFFQWKTNTIERAIARTLQTRRMLLLYSGRTTNFFPQNGHSKGLTTLMLTYGRGDLQSGHTGKLDSATDCPLIEHSTKIFFRLLPAGHTDSRAHFILAA